MENVVWNFIDKYFKDNPSNLVAHHLDSYNDFISKGIFQIFKENNPLRYIDKEEKVKNKEGEIVSYSQKRNECLLYMGGKDGTKIYFGKPIIYDELEGYEPYVHYMYPNQARLRNMTYAITIHYDVDVDVIYYEGNEQKTYSHTIKDRYLGRFPIMLQSNLCILKGMAPEARFNAGECRNDPGGYFIIDGKEKCIVSQEKFADNMIYVKKHKADEKYLFSSEIRSASEDASKPIRHTSVRMVAPNSKYTNKQIVVDVPNVKQAVPLFILMRALGVESDKEIIEYCLLDLESNTDYIDLFIPSVHDANKFFTQETALQYIKTFTKRKTISAVLDILVNYFLPHVGENNFIDKAYYVGYMVNRLLKVYTGQEKPTDRDNFKFKRVETSGNLLYQLFREYYLLQKRQIILTIDKERYYHNAKYNDFFPSLIVDNTGLFFKDRIVEDGIKKGFKGNWGADEKTKRMGAVQDLNRLSWFSFISLLRKVNLPLEASAKIVGPHMLHASQWGYMDPIDTPDGGNIGLHKHMAISCAISNGYSCQSMIKWLRLNTQLKLLQECTPKMVSGGTKVFVNGRWIGIVNEPEESVLKVKLFRRNGVIPIYTSVTYNIESNTIFIYTDDGRVVRPIFFKDVDGKMSPDNETITNIVESGKYTWQQLVTGFETKADESYNPKLNVLYYNIKKLYPQLSNAKDVLDFFIMNKAIIDYIDPSEEEDALIATKLSDLTKSPYYTHMEIDASFILGVLGNCIIFPENNPCTRDTFSCGQSRQAVSMYNSNYQMRIDKMGVVLHYGQTPLVKSRYLQYINNEQQPYGVNAIVAIMCYTGYNVEDAILINEGSIKRGLFRTTYYSMYEEYEEKTQEGGVTILSFFSGIDDKPDIRGIKSGFDYSKLDKYGLIQENTPLDDKTIVIGKLVTSSNSKGVIVDHSVKPKKGQLGYVDKAFITDGEEGRRIAKIRIREERIPGIGDKMASRAGQKGTLGLIIPEANMPFTKDGLKPDLIINPHAIPSRMTLGQLIETLLGKDCALYGAFGDCTAFLNKGSHLKEYGEMLNKAGFHSSGNEILYNGTNGEQIQTEIFIGPTYYMRLKHMVKDKINYRARGPRTALTRQTVQGRANDGGLRIGEMERDGILAHGCSGFLNESYMVRGDEYYMAVCNKTGTIAVYNPSKNIFLSPLADGPLQYSDTIDGSKVIDVMSVFGRSFSIVRIPYAFKLLIQELLVANIQMRIITEDNIDQLMNLTYKSKNLNTLLNSSKEDIKEILKEYKEMVDAKQKEVNQNINIRDYGKGKYSVKPVSEEEEEKEKEKEKEKEDEYEAYFQQSLIKPKPTEVAPVISSESASASTSESLEFSPDYEKVTQDYVGDDVSNYDKLLSNYFDKLPEEIKANFQNLSLEERVRELEKVANQNVELNSLQQYFTLLPKEEQISLVKQSMETQINKLKEIATKEQEQKEKQMETLMNEGFNLVESDANKMVPLTLAVEKEKEKNMESNTETSTSVVEEQPQSQSGSNVKQITI